MCTILYNLYCYYFKRGARNKLINALAKKKNSTQTGLAVIPD